LLQGTVILKHIVDKDCLSIVPDCMDYVDSIIAEMVAEDAKILKEGEEKE